MQCSEVVCGRRRHRIPSHRSITSADYEAIEGCVEGVVPGARGTTHYDCVDEEDGAGEEERGQGRAEVSGGVEAAE